MNLIHETHKQNTIYFIINGPISGFIALQNVRMSQTGFASISQLQKALPISKMKKMNEHFS